MDSRRHVECRPLVRIFTVAQLLPPRVSKMQPLRKQGTLGELNRISARGQTFQLRSNLAVIASRGRKGFAREVEPRRETHLAMRLNFSGDRSVVSRVGDH